MKQILFISFFFISLLSFAQQEDTSIKKIRGFVFQNNMPDTLSEIRIKGIDKKVITDRDGKFEIEASENQILVVSALGFDSKEITITDKNCYKIYLFSTSDYPLFFGSEKAKRMYFKAKRKMERNLKRKIKNGVYDCLE